RTVTGVQTCALPIYAVSFSMLEPPLIGRRLKHGKRHGIGVRDSGSFEAQSLARFVGGGRIRVAGTALRVAVVRRLQPDRRPARRARSARARERVGQPRRALRRETGAGGGARGTGETRAD